VTITVLANDQSGMVLDAAASASECLPILKCTADNRRHIKASKAAELNTAEATHKLTLSCSTARTPSQARLSAADILLSKLDK
jgi:transcription initiation factor TFIIIB Brf1 subunit/transcription initiation factor TFIIB